jgi:hypothetical protein
LGVAVGGTGVAVGGTGVAVGVAPQALKTNIRTTSTVNNTLGAFMVLSCFGLMVLRTREIRRQSAAFSVSWQFPVRGR